MLYTASPNPVTSYDRNTFNILAHFCAYPQRRKGFKHKTLYMGSRPMKIGKN